MAEKILILLLIAVILISGCTGTDVTQITCSDDEKVQSGDAVNVRYIGTLDDGSVFDEGEIAFTAGAGEMIPGFDEAVLGMCPEEEKNVTIPPEKAYPYNPEAVLEVPLEFSVVRVFDVELSLFTDTFGENITIGAEYDDDSLIYPIRVVSFDDTNITLERAVSLGGTYSEDILWDVSVKEINETHVTAERLVSDGDVIMTFMGPKEVSVAGGSITIDMNTPLAGKTLYFYIKVLEINRQ